MINRKFVNRERELKILKEKAKSDNFELIILYGRRRIGKTTLLKKFLENKEHIYFLCSKRKLEYNLKKFSWKISDYLKIPRTEFNSFKEAFEAILSKNKKIIIAIDEFGYLVEKDEGILSDFQEIIDELLKSTKIKLILCGSIVSVMETQVLGYKSPLYGRCTLQIKLKPFVFEDIFKWFEKINFEDGIKIYGVTNNIPKYLEFFEGKNIEEEIKNNFFKCESFLYQDTINILSEELRDYTTYFQILEAIALGYTKITEIANYSFIHAKDVYSYIKVLEKMDIVKRETPLLSSRKSKRGIYKIKDNYFNFWFRFVSPYQDEIESFSLKEAVHNFEKNFNTYLGLVFEELITDLIRRNLVSIIPFTKIGKWWHKDKEIDIVALNEQTKEILFAECKWQTKVNAKKLCKELEEKAQYVQWHNDQRKENFAIFTKSFSKRINEFQGRKVYCFDLKDLEKATVLRN